MREIKKIAKQIFSLDESVLSRSSGGHEISLQSVIDRSKLEDKQAKNLENLAIYIDHTILKPQATKIDIKELCSQANEYKFKSVCVNSCFAKYAKENLENVLLCCVIGFPLGACSTQAKVYETKDALKNGANEIDMVINIGDIKAKNYIAIEREIQEIALACHSRSAILKVIIETCLLEREEKIIACLLSKKAGADFVKTSTGFSTAGATEEDIALMRLVVGPKMGVKASGGIKDKKTALAMLKAGASRIGASSGMVICNSHLRN